MEVEFIRETHERMEYLTIPNGVLQKTYEVMDVNKNPYIAMVLKVKGNTILACFTPEGNKVATEVGLQLCQLIFPEIKNFDLYGVKGVCAFLVRDDVNN